jgi:hypothetical protein
MSAEHEHVAFEVSALPVGPSGLRVDGELLGRFIGAGFHGCAGCRNALLPMLADDPATTVRLVEPACVAIHHAFAGLPLRGRHDRGRSADRSAHVSPVCPGRRSGPGSEGES